ncbi:Discoidin domain-containing receptor 2 [Folsomia candida]|uniref:Discoidin domain-containing receptor 2 n=1 Tax=Folsomia candida TaxID=158441 RepID=A0A226EL20_FOLCA|nr:Discoidin domain-containing receptor 2 [Folsomia candida]
MLGGDIVTSLMMLISIALHTSSGFKGAYATTLHATLILITYEKIRQDKNGGAWCPRPGIEKGVKEYLEIDFVREHRITQTETQGRYGSGMGVEYAENFQLEYWRDALGKWVPYKDHIGRTILKGNVNTYTENQQQLNPPIIASKVRFIPYSLHIRTVCMRVEVYGCNFTGK